MRAGILIPALLLFAVLGGGQAYGSEVNVSKEPIAISLSVSWTPQGLAGGFHAFAEAAQPLPLVDQVFLRVFLGMDGQLPLDPAPRLASLSLRRSVGVALGWQLPWTGWALAPQVRLLRVFAPPEVGVEVTQADQVTFRPFFRVGVALLSLGPFRLDF